MEKNLENQAPEFGMFFAMYLLDIGLGRHMMKDLAWPVLNSWAPFIA